VILLSGALARAAEGWRVFPVWPNAKEPAVTAWQKEATRDPDKIEAWWSANPNYNIGCLVGDEVVVVEVDVRDNKQGAVSLNRIISRYGPLPDTRRHRTSSGGWHYIFKRPGDWQISQGELHHEYPGIDIKTGNAVILLPPSHTEASDRSALGDYTVESDIEPVTAPDWVEELRNAGRSGPRLTVAKGAVGQVGDRNNQLTRMAGSLRRRGQDEQAILNQLATINGSWARPLPVRELAVIARSAMRWLPAPLGGVKVVMRNNKLVTDATSARWLVTSRGDDLRYVSDQGKWLAWDGRRWADSPGAVSRQMWEALQTLYDENRSIGPRGPGSDDCYSLILTLENAIGQSSCWTVASLDPEVSIGSEQLDADPYLFNAGNGVVDLHTGNLLPHDRGLLLTHQSEVDYDPTADMEEWLTFVRWCCCGDEEMVEWLKVALGQSLIGAQQEHMLIFMFGEGGNGKTQLTDAIRLTMGTYALETSADLITVRGRDQLHPEMTASLVGKRFVICPEPDKGTHWNSGRVKSLNGGEKQRARHLYGREFAFTPTHTMVVHGNHQPEMRDHSDGFRRRIKLVPFANTVRMEDRVTELGAKLAGPGVLRWLVEGAIEYQRRLNRLGPSQAVARATSDYIDDQDHIRRWRLEWTVDDLDGWVSSHDLYKTYQFWCRAEGIQYVETKQMVMSKLKGWGFKPKAKRLGGQLTRGWGGLSLIQTTDESLPA
jgi:putative DNA primase/helicase